jgi:hypothetical protein
MQKLPKNLAKIQQKSGTQKSSKNLVRKNPAKIFYDFLNKKPAKNFQIFTKTS